MKRSIRFFLFILIWTTIFARRSKQRSPYIKTPLRGIKEFYKTSEGGRRYAAFQGTPYAQPYVGLPRFEIRSAANSHNSVPSKVLTQRRKMKRIIQLFLLFLVWPAIFESGSGQHSPYIKTPLGGIQGFYKISEGGRRYAAFQGIPYAQPPIGALRFEPPVPVRPWTKDIKALSFSPVCPQDHSLFKQLLQAEDCLYLNIYIPVTKNNKFLPIIFWIFGGGFTIGSGQFYGAKYLMDKDIILVTINHRVGPLGFLSTEDDVVPGNMGLKDQVVALKWVSKNIKYFGGDPKKITLMGVSAGGVSVHYHYLSPQSRGLFRNGISFSGSALNTWAFNAQNALNLTKTFATTLNCPVNDAFLMIQCLKEIPVGSTNNFMRNLNAKRFFQSFPFVPVAEKTSKNYFINDTPKNIMVKGDVYDAPWITGVVQDEGLYMTAGFILNETLVKYTEKNWETVGPLLIFLNNHIPLNQQPALIKKAKEHYFNGESVTSGFSSARKLTRLVGDVGIKIGNVRSAKLFAKVNKSPTRFYYYTYKAAHSVTNAWSNSTVNLGICHADDIYLVLENSYINPTTTRKDIAMLQDMLNYWYSVANEGNPDLGTPWPPLNPSAEFHYMNIAGPNHFSMESNNNFADILFWKKIGI